MEITGRSGLLDYRPGIGWIIARLQQMDEKWPGFVITVLAGSAAEALVPAIENAGIAVDVLPVAEYPRACVWAKSQVTGKQMRHTGQPDMASAIAGVRTKDAVEPKGTFTWVRATPTTDITPAVAMTVAPGQWRVRPCPGRAHTCPRKFQWPCSQ